MTPRDPVATFISARANKEPHSPVNFWLLIILVVGLLAFAVGHFGDGNDADIQAAVGGSGVDERAPSRTYTVAYRFGVFSPTNLRIKAGDTVTFRNHDSGAVHIIATINSKTNRPEFDSVGAVPSDSSFSYTFTNEGVFAYHNAEDERQAGVIIVRVP